MAESVEIEKQVCAGCGVDVREDTAFCFNCGAKVEPLAPNETNGVLLVADENTKAALDELADKLGHAETDEKLAEAATMRKKARVAHRKRNEYRWEPRTDSPVLGIAFAGLVTFAALIVVILLVIWR